MRKLVFILFSLLSYLFSFAQPYLSCLDGAMSRWSVLDYSVTDAGMVSTEIIAYGDIVFDGVVYKKMYVDWSFNPFDAEEDNIKWKNYTPQLYYQWENFFIRESEDASKLYIYDSIEDEEYLISDINLQKGDTVSIFIPSIKVETIVDSIYFKNGLKHVQLHFSDDSLNEYYFNGREPLTFIESVGPNFWFIYPLNGFYAVNCFQNQMIFYKNDEVRDVPYNCPCGYHSPSNSIRTITSDNYHVFIQRDKIEIFFVSDTNIDISIYDIHGRLCYTKNNVSDQKIIIPRIYFSVGIYILKIFDKKKHQLKYKKILL